MKVRRSTSGYSFPKFVAIISSLLLVFSVNIPAQDASVKSEVRLRYISSAPTEATPGIRYVKKSETSANKTSLKILEPTDFDLERKTFDFINQKRNENGLAKLIWSDDAAKLARQHSENMAKHDFFSHVGLNGRMVDQRAIDFGLDKWKSIGENIAFCQGFSNPADFVVQRWMLSDGHRKNLLNRMWKESAIGMAKTDEGKFFFTQIFIVN